MYRCVSPYQRTIRAREARALLPLLEDGGTVEQIRELIAVPPTIDRALRGFARAIQTV